MILSSKPSISARVGARASWKSGSPSVRRKTPSEGALPLFELLDVLPSGIPLCLEVPSSRSAHLPIQQRVDAIAASARQLLRTHEGRHA